MTEFIGKLRKFFISRTFMILLAVVSAIFVSLGREVEGVVFFALLVSVILVVCDDIMTTTLPFLIICVSVLQMYDSFNIFIKYIWLAVPVFAALVFHFVKYRRAIKIGKSFYGILAVTAAVTLGGLGSISLKEYFGGASLYYIAGLGVGMAICYLLIKSQLELPRDYDLREKFTDIMYITGIFACFFMVEIYVENFIAVNRTMELGFLDFFKDPEKYVWTVDGANEHMLQPGNNVSTFLMLCLPFPFYRAAKSNKSMYHLLSAFLMLGALIISRSRGGLYLGTVEFAVCFVAYALMAEDKLSKAVGWFAVALGAVAASFAFVEFGLWERIKVVLEAIDNEIRSPGSGSEARVGLFAGAIENFKESPIFGKGLGYVDEELTKYYSGTKGTMQWYHMMVPQVIGSMGLVGILAYGYQIFGRVEAVVKKFSPYVLTLGLSYLGMLLMSQVNPGEFCPLPYELMVVMLFVLIEKEPNREKPKILIKGE